MLQPGIQAPGSLHVLDDTALKTKQCASECSCCITHVLLLQVSDAVSAVFGGASFDVLHLTVRQVSGIMTGVGAGCCLVWTLYAWWQCRQVLQQKNAALGTTQTQP